jgi:hypothetical protein
MYIKRPIKAYPSPEDEANKYSRDTVDVQFL